jgi:hypothetical protein
VDKSTVSRRVNVAVQKEYLDNLEPRRGKPARLVLGDPLPDDREILPSPETLEADWSGCAVARSTEGKGTDPGEDNARTL